jgi:hypothetical protein
MLPAIAAQGMGLQLLAAACRPAVIRVSKTLAGCSMRGFSAETAAAAGATAAGAPEREDPASRVTKHLKVRTLGRAAYGVGMSRMLQSTLCCCWFWRHLCYSAVV